MKIQISAACAALVLGGALSATPVLAQTYTEGFESVTPPALPTGWSAAGPNVWRTGTESPASGVRHLRVDASIDSSESTVNFPVLTASGAAASITFQRSNPGLEVACDGLRLLVSVNGGAFTDALSAGGSFSAGGYAGTPGCIDDESAWSQRNDYVTTTYDMPALATGDTVAFQLRLLMDSSVSSGLISIDDISATGLSNDAAETPAPDPVAVPTLSEWAMILFGTILAGGAALYVQRRQRFV